MDFHIKHLKIVESTQAYLDQWSEKEDLQDGTVVFADHQSNGKGMGKNNWKSETGKNILLSVFLKPDRLLSSRVFLISQMVSLSIIDFLNELGVKNCQIKWPNDIYVGERKIAGILIKNELGQPYVVNSIAGIGININQDHFSSDIPNPVSLRNLLNIDFMLEELKTRLLSALGKSYADMQGSDYSKINTEYHAHLYLKDLMHEYSLPGGSTIKGRIRGVSDDGRLMLEADQLYYFDFKGISF